MRLRRYKRFLLLLLLPFGLLAALGLGYRQQPEAQGDALAIWHKSLTQGADAPMRAEMTMTQRQHGRTLTTQAHVVQGARGRFRMEYILPVEARGRIVFSDGQTNWQYEPLQNLLAKTTLVPMSEQRDREVEALIESNYRMALVSGRESIAGRSTYVMDLLPHHAGKSSQRRWIDKQTYKTLRVETHYTDGILARMVTYDQVTLPAVVAEADFLPMQAKNMQVVSTPASSVNILTRAIPEQFASLELKPEAALGFQLIQVSSSEIDRLPATQLLYSDGIETVSIFVQQGDQAVLTVPANWKKLAIRNISVFENIDGHLDALTWIRNGRRYTAVSHLTPSALQSFVTSQLP
ncbi:MAG TPA: sigma-E factor regulatory protein RseB domain-containing protein [Chthonomonadaceae bacterium]|nr:sigma-E factor regulatory protein RseB domain-containing protein [Chthonomonadaceae bacterium]